MGKICYRIVKKRANIDTSRFFTMYYKMLLLKQSDSFRIDVFFNSIFKRCGVENIFLDHNIELLDMDMKKDKEIGIIFQDITKSKRPKNTYLLKVSKQGFCLVESINGYKFSFFKPKSRILEVELYRFNDSYRFRVRDDLKISKRPLHRGKEVKVISSF